MLKNKERHEKAVAGSLFAKVQKRNQRGWPVSMLVPGSVGKQYEVHIKYPGDGRLVVECFLVTPLGLKHCPSQKVCYHAVAAIMAIVHERDKAVSFFEDVDEALNQKRKMFGILSLNIPMDVRQERMLWGVTR